MGGRDLPIRILQHVRVCSLQDSRRSAAKTRRVLAQLLTATAGLYSNQPNFLVLDEVVEDPDRIRATAYAGDDCSRQLPFRFQDLCPRLASDYAMKVPHHGGIGVRAQHTSQ